MIYERHTKCKCLCDCGNIIVTTADHIQSAAHPSCGCMSSYYRSIANSTNEIGKTFGQLTIIDIDRSSRPAKAICRCACGNMVIASKSDVVTGHTLSCGCLQSQRSRDAATKDFTNYVSESGVKIVSKAYQDEHGTWMWNCICPLCGQTFVALPAKVKANHTTSCGCKVASSRERMIETFLTNHHIHYEKQKRFADCVNKYTLPFDFVVYNPDNTIKCLIEYDGKQHFEPISFWGGDDFYKEIVKRDAIKTQYCKDNNLPLIRIAYHTTDQELYNILTNIIYP